MIQAQTRAFVGSPPLAPPPRAPGNPVSPPTGPPPARVVPPAPAPPTTPPPPSPRPQAALSNPPSDDEYDFVDNGSLEDASEDLHEDGSADGDYSDPDDADDEGLVEAAEGEGDDDDDDDESGQITINLEKLSAQALEALTTLTFLVERTQFPNPALLMGVGVAEVEGRVRALLEARMAGAPAEQREMLIARLSLVLREVPQAFPALAAAGAGGEGADTSDASDDESGAGDPEDDSDDADAAPAPKPAAGPSLPARPAGLGSGLRPRPAASAAAATAAPSAAAGRPVGAGAAPSVAPVAAPVAETRPAAQRAEVTDPALKKVRSQAQRWRVIWARLMRRLGYEAGSPEAQQVFQRIGFAERMHSSDLAASAGAATEAAFEEAARLDGREGDTATVKGFQVTVLCIGMTGSGKSTTIANLCGDDESKWPDAFSGATRGVKVRHANIKGIQFKFIDTPGLSPSAADRGANMRAVARIKGVVDKHKPQVVLYFDRMDLVQRNLGDLEMLKAISQILGRQVWYNTPMLLTHAGVTPGEGTTGPLQYDQYVQQRAQLLVTTVRQSAGDNRIQAPVLTVENHAKERRADGEPLLPSGKPWRQSVLLVTCAVGILQSLDDDMKMSKKQQAARGNQDAFAAMFGGFNTKMPPLPFLVTNLANSHPPKKAPEDEKDIKFDYEISDLPPEEAKEETRRKRDLENQRRQEAVQSKDAPGSIGPEPPQNPTFEQETTGGRYRYLQSDTATWRAIPAIDNNYYEKDDGITATQLENSGMLRPLGRHIGGNPFSAMCQISKDKNAFNMQGSSEVSVYVNRSLVGTGMLDLQTMQEDALLTATAETRVVTLRDKLSGRKNKAVAGACVSRLAEKRNPTKGPIALGAKLENRFTIEPNSKVWGSVGMMTTKVKVGTSAQRETAYAGNLEFKHKRGEDESTKVTAGATLLRYRKDTTLNFSLQGQGNVTEGTNAFSKATLNNKGSGSLSLRVGSTDKVEIGWAMLVPVLGALWGKIRGDDAF